MLDPISPAKYLLFAWLVTTSVLLGVRLTRHFVGVREPLDSAGYGLALSILILGAPGSWMARLTRNLPSAFVLLAILMSVPLVLDVKQRLSARRVARAEASKEPRVFSRGNAAILSPSERVGALALGALALAAPLNMVWRTHLWDDWYFYLPLTSAFSRGVVPVVYPFLPDRALTYHFGFAWIAGVVEYHTGISPEHCVDIVSTVLLVAFYLSAAATFRLWVGGRLAPYLAASVAINFGPFAWLWMLFHNSVHEDLSWIGSWVREAQTTFSNEVARPADYLLQKPMLAGMALIWIVMALFFAARRRASVPAAVAAGISVGMLELFQYPMALLAGLAGSAVLFIELVFRKSRRRRRLLMLIAFGIAAAALPWLNGGFVANPQGDPIITHRVLNFPYPAFVEYAKAHGLSTLLCYLLYYGASIFVLPFVVRSLWRQRSLNTVWMIVFGLAAFAVPHVIRHRSSPVNITKFFQISAFALATLSVAGLLAATRSWRSGLRASVLTAYLIAVSLSTWVSSLDIATPRSGGVVPAATVSSLRHMARWLRAHAGTYDRVFALSDDVEAMSGILSPLPPFAPGGRQIYTVTAHGYAPEYIATISALTESLAASLDDGSLARLRIRWIVLPEPLPATIGAEARRRLGQTDLFQLRHQTPDPGGWLIYEYLKGPLPGGLDR